MEESLEKFLEGSSEESLKICQKITRILEAFVNLFPEERVTYSSDSIWKFLWNLLKLAVGSTASRISKISYFETRIEIGTMCLKRDLLPSLCRGFWRYFLRNIGQNSWKMIGGIAVVLRYANPWRVYMINYSRTAGVIIGWIAKSQAKFI